MVTKAVVGKKLGTMQIMEQDFLNALGAGVNSFQKAGECLAALVKDDPDYIQKAAPRLKIQVSTLQVFYRIGIGALRAELFTAPSCIQHLPVSDQEKVIRGDVEALVYKADNTTDVIKVDVLSPKNSFMLPQIVNRNGLRSLSEQKTFLIDRTNKANVLKSLGSVSKVPYEIDSKKKTVVFRKNTKMTEQEVKQMLLLFK